MPVTEAEARHLLLVRAVETEDTAFSILTTEDRQQATAAGLRASDGRDPRSAKEADARFLVARSAFAFTRLVTRVPALAQADRQVRWPGRVTWAVPGLALVLGAATNALDGAGRLNIIAFPLLTMLAWNLVMYAVLLALSLRRLGRGRLMPEGPGALTRLIGRVMGRARPARGGTVTARAIGRFVSDWLSATAELNQTRVQRTLHLAAAALAAGVLLGMYARALGVEYRAGWESTFIDAGTLQRVVQVVLAPASALTGVGLPDVARLEAIRWRGEGGGENAGPWIHLFATTAALFIIAPRLMLASWAAARAGWLSSRVPVPGREDFQTRRLLRDARDVGALVRVVPYSFRMPSGVEDRLTGLLKGVLGDRARVQVDAPVAFGTDDPWLEALSIDPDTDHVVVLFNLAATPEAETHGAFVARIKAHIDQDRGGAALTAVIDESAYGQRLAGQAGFAQRLEARRKAWTSVIGRSGVPELALDLSSEDEPALLTRLESVMMQDAALTSAGRSR